MRLRGLWVAFLVLATSYSYSENSSSAPDSPPTSRPIIRSRPTSRVVQPKKPKPILLAHVRQAAFQILFNRCGTCHIRSLPTSKKGALRTFDLEKKRWWRTIKPKQLEALRDIFVHAPGSFAAQEVKQIKRFVQQELLRKAPTSRTTRSSR